MVWQPVALSLALAWVPKALVVKHVMREPTSSTSLKCLSVPELLKVSWADSGISEPADWAGKKVGNWGFGNEFELTAAIEPALA